MVVSEAGSCDDLPVVCARYPQLVSSYTRVTSAAAQAPPSLHLARGPHLGEAAGALNGVERDEL